MPESKKTLLLVTQVYLPDPAAVGQQMADAAEAMAAKGWRVIVFAANRGYDDPAEKYPKRELLNGVEVIRLPFSSLGKKTLVHRIVGQLSFCFQSFVRGLFVRRLANVLVTTSPPMGSVVGWALGKVRRVPIRFWVMDINPDLAVKLDNVQSNAWSVRLFDWFNRRVLKSATSVIALDRYMAQTIQEHTPVPEERMFVMPPWPMQGYLERIPHESNPFRREHNLEDKFVVMYSGNHGLANPLDTVLKAARRMQEVSNVVFMFIGGGREKDKIDKLIAEENPPNIRSLPYQPIENIKYSLSAADVHLASMGNEMVGIIHPCKFYGAMALAKPVLSLGPDESHVGDVLREFDCGWSFEHGNVDGVENLLRGLAVNGSEEIEAKGREGLNAIENHLSKEILCEQLCSALVSSGQPAQSDESRKTEATLESSRTS